MLILFIHADLLTSITFIFFQYFFCEKIENFKKINSTSLFGLLTNIKINSIIMLEKKRRQVFF